MTQKGVHDDTVATDADDNDDNVDEHHGYLQSQQTYASLVSLTMCIIVSPYSQDNMEMIRDKTTERKLAPEII